MAAAAVAELIDSQCVVATDAFLFIHNLALSGCELFAHDVVDDPVDTAFEVIQLPELNAKEHALEGGIQEPVSVGDFDGVHDAFFEFRPGLVLTAGHEAINGVLLQHVQHPVKRR